MSSTLGNDRYEVIKISGSEGPEITTSTADYMKPYINYPSGTEGESGLAECRTRTSPRLALRGTVDRRERASRRLARGGIGQ